MSGKATMDPAGAGNAGPSPVLAPQLTLPAPMAAVAVIAVGLAAGVAFLTFGNPESEQIPGPGSGATAAGDRGESRVFSVSADQTTGAFRILPTSFQKQPNSVLAQLNLPEAEKKRLAEKLADGSVRLASITVWDTVAEDGDAIELSAAGFTQRLVIMHKPRTFFLPVQPGGSASIRAVRDGGGGVTLGVSTILGPYRLPPLAVGDTVEIPVL